MLVIILMVLRLFLKILLEKYAHQKMIKVHMSKVLFKATTFSNCVVIFDVVRRDHIPKYSKELFTRPQRYRQLNALSITTDSLVLFMRS